MHGEQRIGLAATIVVASEHRETHKILSNQTCVIRNRIIDGRMRPDDQSFRVVRREIIAAMVGIGVMRIQRMLPGQRAVEVRLLAGGLEYCEGRPDHRGIVGGQSGYQKPSGAPGMS